MRYSGFPVSLYLNQRKVLLVGSNPHTAGLTDKLHDASALVEPCAWSAYSRERCAGMFLVIAACDTDQDAARLRDDAHSAGSLFYTPDRPALSDFAIPALASRGPLKLAISTDALAPALARRLREELQRLLNEAGSAIDLLLRELADARAAAPPGKRQGLYDIARRLSLPGRIVLTAADPSDDTH